MRPDRLFIFWVAVWVVMAWVVTFRVDWQSLWGATGLVLFFVACVDWILLMRSPGVAATRRLPQSLPLGVWGEVKIRLTSRDGNAKAVQLFDHHPSSMETQGLPLFLEVPGKGWTEVTYRLLPQTRGDQKFQQVELLLRSPLRLWRKRGFEGQSETVRVYPNFSAVAKYALLATDNKLSQLGIRKRRRRGEGLEFHQLREYRPGDSLRQIDWKATSKLHRLISREYQDQRDQQIIFLIDCGRRMSAKDGDLSHFDHSLNSVLLLAYVALRQGDAVGLMTFSGTPRYVAARKGASVVNVMLDELYDLQPGMRSSDYASAATELRKRVRKRSLVVFVTNLRDDDSAELMPVLNMLGSRHLVLVASLREQIIDSVLKQPVNSFEDALRHAATHRYLLGRRTVHDAIAKSGAISLDVEPEYLPVAMVNRYLDLKRSGRL